LVAHFGHNPVYKKAIWIAWLVGSFHNNHLVLDNRGVIASNLAFIRPASFAGTIAWRSIPLETLHDRVSFGGDRVLPGPRLGEAEDRDEVHGVNSASSFHYVQKTLYGQLWQHVGQVRRYYVWLYSRWHSSF